MPLHHRLLIAASPLLLVAACTTTASSDASAPVYQAPEVMTGSRVPHGSGTQPTQSASGESVRNSGGLGPTTVPRQMGTN